MATSKINSAGNKGKPQKAASKASAKSEEDALVERIGDGFDDLGDAIVLAIKCSAGVDVGEEVSRLRSRRAKRDAAFQRFLHRATRGDHHA